MNKGGRLYGKLFLSTLSLSAFTFGGGYVMIPLMRRKFVIQYRWLDAGEMLDIAAIAQSAPGAMAVNAAILIGYRLAGIPGAMVTILGTVLPPLTILSVVSLFYTALRSSGAVGAILWGMQAAVGAVIADVTISMGMDMLKGKRVLPAAIMLAAFAAACAGMDVLWIILISGGAGAFAAWFRQRHPRKGRRHR